MQCPQSSPGRSHKVNAVVIKTLDTRLCCRSSVIVWIETVIIVAFSIALLSFAKKQEIWVDETTQLSGITLKFGEMLRWLSGQDVGRFGVPGDRMPPISYILDWAWLRLFGTWELGFRLFHAAFLMAGIVVLAATARRNLGWAASLITLAILCLSPKMMAIGVEIRAYPIFFATTCAQTAVFARILKDRSAIDRSLLASFVAISTISIYSHFFGLVSSCAFFLTLGLAYIRRRTAIFELVAAFAIMTVSSVGILPFVSSAALNSRASDEAANTHQYIVYGLKLFGDPANMISRPAAVLFFGGMLGLMLMSTICATTRMLKGRANSVDWLLIVVVAGVAATLGASLFVKSFDVLKETYSAWLFAPLALLAANGLTGSRQWNGVYAIVIVMTIAGAACSTYTFLAHASDFIHGPGRFVGALYDRAGPPKAVFYEVDAADGWSYFPLVFSHKGQVPQYRATDGGAQVVRMVSGAIQPAPQATLMAATQYDNLILVDVRLRTYGDIRRCLASTSRCPKFHPGPVHEALITSGHWQEVAVDRQFGLYDTQVEIFKSSD